MKKFLLLIAIAICISIIIPRNVYAVDITVGGSTWYSWWNQKQWNKNGSGDTTNFDPTFFYGPALSVKFSNDFNLTFVYLYAKFENEKRDSSGKTTIKHKRTDSDLALNYRLNGYFKIFGGVKYMPYKSSGTDGTISSHSDHSGFGPGLGVSCTYPILDNLFLLANLSGFYLWSNEDFSSDTGADDFKHNYKRYGFNSTLSIAYYIVPAATTISLGTRLQYYKSDYNYEDVDYIDNLFYGVTLTATYSFSI